jgi:hypothetical protein
MTLDGESKVLDGKTSFYCCTDIPYGIPISRWAGMWWAWLLSVPLEKNPAFDETGENSSINQRGPVWFLAGTFNGGFARRRCKIPEGLSILIPIINWSGTLSGKQNARPKFNTMEDIETEARIHMDGIDHSKLRFAIDDQGYHEIASIRVQSRFEVELPEHNLLGDVNGPTSGAADGYWIFLKPLKPGISHVQSFGTCMSGAIQIGVNLELEVF